MDYVFKLIQYFLLIDIAGSIKNIIKYHIPFYLIANIEIAGAKNIIGSLLVPGDLFFKIPQELLVEFYNYLKFTQFWPFFCTVFVKFSQKLIFEK